MIHPKRLIPDPISFFALNVKPKPIDSESHTLNHESWILNPESLNINSEPFIQNYTLLSRTHNPET